MMCTICDAISGRKLARTRIVKASETEMLLSNSNKEASVLLDLAKEFKLITDDGRYCGKVKTSRMSKSYISVSLIDSERNDARRYLRLPCNFDAYLYSCGCRVECKITELAYGSCMINCLDGLLSDEEAIIQLSVGGANLAINGVVKFEKKLDESEDDLWCVGREYMITFEESNNFAETKDELYGLLLRMLRNVRAESYA